VTKAAQGTLGWLWRPRPMEPDGPLDEATPDDRATSVGPADPP
jgi:hypothetical protein